MNKILVSIVCAVAAVFSCTAAEIPTITVAQDGSGDFTTVTAALKKLRGDLEDPVRIFVKNGRYEEKILINNTLNNVIIEGENPDSTIITYSDYAQLRNMGTSGSYTVRVDGNNITFRNITFENGAGRVGQAVAMHTTGDCISFFNCRFLGNQDTLYATGRNSRAYFEDCYVEGTVDFIFGAATALFKNCHIHAKGDGYLTAASTPRENAAGYVFHKCKVTAADEVKQTFLGRPWRPYASTFFIECELPDKIPAAGWHNWGNAENEKTARYGESGCYGPGAGKDSRVKWAKSLTKKEIRKLTDPGILFTRTSSWIPSEQKMQKD